jgi:hypothetical protein
MFKRNLSIFQGKRKEEKVPEVLKAESELRFPVGSIVYTIGEYPRHPKVVYGHITSGQVMAGEYLVTNSKKNGLNVQFVRYVCAEPNTLATYPKKDETDDLVEAFLLKSYEEYKTTRLFIQDMQDDGIVENEHGEPLYKVEVRMDFATAHYTWKGLELDAAIELYNSLFHARQEKLTWESDKSNKSRMCIYGGNISAISILPENN